jgi:hypothetical protein
MGELEVALREALYWEADACVDEVVNRELAMGLVAAQSSYHCLRSLRTQSESDWRTPS